MARFSAKRTLIYAVCVFIVYRILSRIYSYNSKYSNRSISFLSLHRTRNQITEASIIIEPLQQHEEKNIDHVLLNQSDEKNESDKNLTLTTINRQLDLLNTNKTQLNGDLVLPLVNKTKDIVNPIAQNLTLNQIR